MNFKIDDILKGTVDGVSKEELANVISEVIETNNSDVSSENKKEK